MRKFFSIWFFILMILVFGYFLYNVTARKKKPDVIKNNPVVKNYLITPIDKIA